jgi:hypothetical protein
MARNKPLVAQTRKYLVITVAEAKEITQSWLNEIQLQNVVTLGLPEIDDRHHIWRVPLCSGDIRFMAGELGFRIDWQVKTECFTG